MRHIGVHRRLSIPWFPSLLCIVLFCGLNLLWMEKQILEAKLASAEAKLSSCAETPTRRAGPVVDETNSPSPPPSLSPLTPSAPLLQGKDGEVTPASGNSSQGNSKKRVLPGLPDACYSCQPGGDGGGVALDTNGVCRHFCSMGNYCGTTAPYRATDCTKACAGSHCLWQFGTPQTSADAFWIANALIPFDRATRRFDLDSSKCARMQGVNPHTDKLWIDVGAHDTAIVPPHGIVFAFEPQLWLYQQVVQQSQGNPCVFPIPAACSPGAASFQMFHTSNNFHSSSLLKVDMQAAEQLGTWTGAVSQDHDLVGQIDFSVLTISLEEVITRLPPCQRVDFLKIDAQGFDLNVAQSAGSWIRVVDRVEIETPGPKSTPLYVGAPTKADIVAWFTREGFEKTGEETSCCQGEVIEQNVYFKNVRFTDLVISSSCPNFSSQCAPVPRAACSADPPPL